MSPYANLISVAALIAGLFAASPAVAKPDQVQKWGNQHGHGGSKTYYDRRGKVERVDVWRSLVDASGKERSSKDTTVVPKSGHRRSSWTLGDYGVQVSIDSDRKANGKITWERTIALKNGLIRVIRKGDVPGAPLRYYSGVGGSSVSHMVVVLAKEAAKQKRAVTAHIDGAGDVVITPGESGESVLARIFPADLLQSWRQSGY